MKQPVPRALVYGLSASPARWVAGLGCCALIALAGVQTPRVASAAQEYEVVILHGRVMDPESGLDAVRNICIANGTIQVISDENLRGRTTIEAEGLVISPGFIDLHQHGQDQENYRAKAMDGVTTALELEYGTADVDRWYAERDGKALINYGVSVGHMPIRMNVMRESGSSAHNGDAAHRAASEAAI